MATSQLMMQTDLKTLWDMAVDHAFVRALIKGDLPHDKFRDYLVQDKIFCDTFRGFVCSILADCSDADEFETVHKHIAQLQGYKSEAEMFRQMFEKLNIVNPDLRAYPTTEAFCNFLWRVSSAGSFAEKLIVLYAVYGSYMEWADRAVTSGSIPPDEVYAHWIHLHEPKNLKPLVEWIQGKLDVLLGPSGERIASHHRQLFKRALQYEILFWDTALKPGSSLFPGEFALTHSLNRSAGH